MEKMFYGDAAKWLLDQAAKRGADPGAILGQAGLPADWAADPEALLPASVYQRLVLAALEQSRDPTLALGAAREFSYVSRFGYWGYAILSSATWEQAARIALRYWDVSGSLARPEFFEDGETCGWEIFPAVEPVHEKILIFAVEKVLSSSFATIEFATGSPPPLREILVSYAPPEHAALYPEYWRAPVRFRQPRNLVRMDRAVLERPILLANAQIMQTCQEQCHQLLANLRQSDELVELIRRLIIGRPGDFPGAEQTARRLGLSPRTLRRRLRDRGTNYQALLDEVRAELALGYLTATNLSMDEIAGLVGFAETTTFRRTFKKWRGKSAAQVRRAARDPG
ncbi:MAG: AraC family transcriptional regulator [Deltaproteobacteria bacterium]|nr:AraC family transcriptional regulator [Deltaproteobacteria bacterium]